MLYLEFSWNSPTQSGSSYSPIFAVTQRDPLVLSERGAIQALKDEMVAQEGQGSGPYKDESITSNSVQSSASSTPANLPSPTQSTSTGEGTESTSSSGLSTGAAAGIGAGVGAVALIVIGVLLWFFCVRRRRRNDAHRNHPGASYTSDSGVGVMMPDKEAAGITESSPQSAYGDDGARFADRNSLALHSVQHDEAAYAPYTDAAAPGAALTGTGTGHNSIELPRRQASGESAPINASGTATPPVNSRYAHLIEEGMTEDEIRRLEEEERHLDAAIEQAGSRQSRTRP
jgi:hypothetical protein